ncbi:hypothetical protein [Pseudomonas umsongensis]|jgi:hypothetical protein|uniref:hypothetical protein n=1 Tax=Pseudomonas umsongensis TaxID=198618 RepID=UPI0015B9BF38|nr:hypothetical protein [Pseudomonas umsongensis]NWL23376.1 hypothetical protein [Pseudomonas umsongensis]
MNFNRLYALAFVYSLTACTTAPEQSVVLINALKAEGGEQAPVDDVEFRRLFEEKLNQALEFCTPILSGMEKESTDGARKAFWLSMGGLLAGSVVAPGLTAANASANAGWIGAFSGFGGAAGFAGKNYESLGLNGRGQASQRNDIVERFRIHITTALDVQQDKQTRLNALYGAKVECVMYKAFTPQLSVENEAHKNDSVVGGILEPLQPPFRI